VGSFDLLLHGLWVALDPTKLMYLALGVTLGTAIGVLPGLGPAVTIALLLPLTSSIDPATALIMFAGIYYGAMYGGSTTSILVNTPGESTSVVTAFEGYQMARRGRAGAALATAAVGSFVAGNLAAIGLVIFSPLVVSVALRFGPAEYFALMVLALTTVTGLLGQSLLKGIAALLVGFAVGTIGLDLQTGQSRFTFDLLPLLDGVDIVNVAVGLFGIGEVLWSVALLRFATELREPLKGPVMMTREEWRRSWKPWLRGSFFGFSIGSLPAGGADIPTFLSYSVEKKLSKHKDEWGKGAIEGVAGPEAANNAASGAALMPLLTLGIPTSSTAAILLAAFIQYGLNPGPLLFISNPDLVWGLIASLYLGNLALIVLNLPLIGIWVRVLSVPPALLYPSIIAFGAIGAWSLNFSAFDLGIMVFFGILSFFMRREGFPLAPAILGLVLGPRLEQQFRQAMTIAGGDVTDLVTRPISGSILLIAFLVLIGPYIYNALQRPKTAKGIA
jgi:putative tricarboxylic transport membrane protein